MTLEEQLYEFYGLETWHKTRLVKEEFIRYTKHLIEQGNILTVSDGEPCLGYCEFWRLNYEQFGRIICGEEFSALHEDVQTGHIAYVANTFIRPDFRKGRVYMLLRNKFFQVNRNCTHFVGEARRKSTAPLKVFKASKLKVRG